MAANELLDYMKENPYEGFAPQPYYSKEGDFLTYYFIDDDFHAERLDETLTIYYSMSDNSFVGFKLKGIRNILATLGEFSLYVSDGKEIMLGLLFWAGMQKNANHMSIEHYQRFATKTKDIPVNLSELESASS
jgi:hypothetical protein